MSAAKGQPLPLAEQRRLLDSLFDGPLFEPLVPCAGCGQELSRRAVAGHGDGRFWCRPCAERLDDRRQAA